LCDVAKAVLKKYQQTYAFDLVETDITLEEKLFEEFKEQIPVVFIDGKKMFKYRIDEERLVRKLSR